MSFLSETRLFTAGHPDDLVEKHGGHIVAFAVGIAAFAILSMKVYPLPQQIESALKLRIILEAPPVAPPVPDIEDTFQPDNAFTDIVATSVNASEQAVAALAVRAQELAARPSEKKPTTDIASWKPSSPDEIRRVEELRQSVLDFRDRLDSEQSNLNAELNRISIESAGRRFLLNSDGGRTGVIRTLDTADFPQHIVRPILERYGITIEYKHVNPEEEQGRGFLNAATTSSGTYTSVAQEGFYEVFVLSPKAVSMLATKEMTALHNRGYDPRTTRIRQIKFGIVKNEEDRFDLDVIDLEVERVR